MLKGCEGKEEGHWNCVRIEDHGQKIYYQREQNSLCEVGTHCARSIGSSRHCAVIFHISRLIFSM